MRWADRGLRPQSQPLGLRTGSSGPPQDPVRQAQQRKWQEGLASKGCVSLAGRIHLPGTWVTGNDKSPTACHLPPGMSAAWNVGCLGEHPVHLPQDSPGTARTSPTPCSLPCPWGLGLVSGAPQPKGTCHSGKVGTVVHNQSQEETRGLEGGPPKY